MNIRYFTVAALALLAVFTSAQYDNLTEEQIDELAADATLRNMAKGMSSERIAYVQLLLSSPKVAMALETGERFSLYTSGDQIPVFLSNANDYGAQGLSQSSNVVAYYGCWDFKAHNPHRGSGVGTGGVRLVKAKSEAKCILVPLSPLAPSPNLVDWSLNMTLLKRSWVSIPAISTWLYLPVGYAKHARNGTWHPRWKQNSADGQSGTQVLHALGLCVNGSYRNFSTLWIDVPPPYIVRAFGFIGLTMRAADVTNC